jgi:hypothetical protein
LLLPLLLHISFGQAVRTKGVGTGKIDGLARLVSAVLLCRLRRAARHGRNGGPLAAAFGNLQGELGLSTAGCCDADAEYYMP